MNFTFGRKLALGFAFAVSVIIGVGIAGHQSTEDLVETSEWVDHTHKVIQSLTLVESLMKDAETSARGFVLAGRDSMLEPYLTANRELPREIASLRRLIVDNPRQQKRLDELETLLDRKLSISSGHIEARRAEGLEGGARRVQSGDGQAAMQDIHRSVQEMIAIENDLLETRSAQAKDSAAAARAVILWGSLLGTLLIVVVGAQISSSLTRQIGAAVGHIQASSAELQAAANQQAAGATEQASAVSEITTTIGELLATSRQIAESAQRVAQIAGRTSDSARGGDGTVLEGNQSMASMRRQVDSIVTQMLDLGKKSQQIGAVLDIVSELAEQTNILAVNATIEAVGAGDAGSRFFAVADEIRKLADRVGGSTKEIRSLIEEVRGAVNTAIMTTESGSKTTDASTEQFALVARSFSEISSQVLTTTEAAREIELSTKQQASAVEQVSTAIVSVAQAAKESEVSTTQTLRTASELSRLSSQLLRLVAPKVATSPLAANAPGDG